MRAISAISEMKIEATVGPGALNEKFVAQNSRWCPRWARADRLVYASHSKTSFSHDPGAQSLAPTVTPDRIQPTDQATHRFDTEFRDGLGDSFDRCKRLSLLRKSEGRKIFSPKNQPEKPKYLDIHANS